MNSIKTLFTNNYLPSVQYFSHWLHAKDPIIEKYDNYLKRTYRNRCDILAANGVISLTIPIAKGNVPKINAKDVKISYDTKWQVLHWRSILSAYSSSPFFEYYLDDFKPFYDKKYQFLFDYNMDLMKVIFDALDLKVNFIFTEEFVSVNDKTTCDYREIIHPKKDFTKFDSGFKPLSYRQVFHDRFPFTPNLSVIDLIFNKGPEAIDILEDSIKDYLII